MVKKEFIEPSNLTIKKNNSLTDGYLPISAGKAVLPDKLINALYWKFEQHGSVFDISMSELRTLLGLKHGKDDERIYNALALLQISMQVRNFTFKGREIEWMSAPFLQKAIKWKDKRKFLEIYLDDMMVEALKQKMGYTSIDLEICNKFKTKYGLKLYEMYLRYYSLPNREGKEVGKISKTLDELNGMFGTKYKHPSKLLNRKEAKTLAPINRGLNEIEKITGEFINCFYDELAKKFIFGWHQKEKYPKLRIPYSRIDELIDWYLEHHKELKINSLLKYKKGLKKSIINDEFNSLDKFYRGMLQWRYNLNPNDFFDKKSGKYEDF